MVTLPSNLKSEPSWAKALLVVHFLLGITEGRWAKKARRAVVRAGRASVCAISLCPSVISVMTYFSWLSGFRYGFALNSTPRKGDMKTECSASPWQVPTN